MCSKEGNPQKTGQKRGVLGQWSPFLACFQGIFPLFLLYGHTISRFQSLETVGTHPGNLTFPQPRNTPNTTQKLEISASVSPLFPLPQNTWCARRDWSMVQAYILGPEHASLSPKDASWEKVQACVRNPV